LPKKKIAIIGAGVTGLYAGMELVRKGYDVNIFEKENDFGGLASGKIINNNIYEYGPHFFHTDNPKILREIKGLTGDDLVRFERTILIKFMDEYFVYPLSIFEVLKKLPGKVVMSAALSLMKNNLLRLLRKPGVETSETILLKYYGNILYEMFFKNYIFHVWGIYPDKFSPEFALERIPKITGSIFINKILSPLRSRLTHQSTKHYIENVDGQLYTTRWGYRGIIKKMVDNIEDRGGKIHLNSEVSRINIENNLVDKITIKSDNKIRNLKIDALINTMPINQAVMSISPGINNALKESSNALEFRALVFVGVLVNKSKVLPVSFMYFREHSFNRIYDSWYFSHDTIIPNTTILVAEISCSKNDRWWNDENYCREKVLKDLIKEGIVNEEDVLEINVYKYEFGYPIYKLDYDKHLNSLVDFIGKIKNFETAGRQGKFQYINGHVAMQMGLETAEIIHKNFKSFNI
jgi:protoporphyrinogen oxidase